MSKYCSIGGQALIEGVMMRGKKTSAVAVRTFDNEIVTKTEEIKGLSVSPLLKIPFVRGSLSLISSMIVGTKALMWSAEFFEVEDEDGAKDVTSSKSQPEPGRFEKFLYDKLGDKADSVVIWISVFIALIMAVLLFAVLPTTLISFLKPIVGNMLVLSVLEGITKITVFVVYILLVSKNKDIRRVFEYHGAEHKAIHCFEAGEELTPENAQKFSTLHPRCGTSFILIVILVSIAIFTFIPWSSVAFRIVLKVVLLPVIAGISYEIIKWTGTHNSKFSKAISYPGMMMQKLTTKEPDLEQLEVAIAAMNIVIENETLRGDLCAKD